MAVPEGGRWNSLVVESGSGAAAAEDTTTEEARLAARRCCAISVGVMGSWRRRGAGPAEAESCWA